MSEAFADFGQNYRTLFSSLLAFASSGVVAATLIVKNNANLLSDVLIYSYKICVLSFMATIVVAIISSYVGLSHEVNEGKSTASLSPRIVNDKKFAIIRLSLIPFSIGFLSFVLLLILIPLRS